MKKYRIVETIRANGSHEFDPQIKEGNKDWESLLWSGIGCLYDEKRAKEFIKSHKGREIVKTNYLDYVD